MDVKETLELYREGPEKWNIWAREKLAKKKKLEEEGKWEDVSGEEAKNWREEATVDFSGVGFVKAGISKKDMNPDADVKIKDFIYFKDIINFKGFVFPGYAKFVKTVFRGEVVFEEAKFWGDANFITAKFHGVADFWKTKFCCEACFKKAEFFGEANFRFAEFYGDAVFVHAVFKGDAAFFSVAKFNKCTDFCAVQVDKNFALAGAIFRTQTPDFTQARFSEVPRLDNLEFGEDVEGLSFLPMKFFFFSWFFSWIKKKFERAVNGEKFLFFFPRLKEKDEFALQVLLQVFWFFSLVLSITILWALKKGFSPFEDPTTRILAQGVLVFLLPFILFMPSLVRNYDKETAKENREIRLEESRKETKDRGDTAYKANSYPARYRAMLHLAIQAHDYDCERRILKGDMRSRRFSQDKVWNAGFWGGILYDLLSDFGGSIGRPLFSLVGITFIFAWLYTDVIFVSGVMNTNNQPLTFKTSLSLSAENSTLNIIGKGDIGVNILDSIKPQCDPQKNEKGCVAGVASYNEMKVSYNKVKALQGILSAGLWFLVFLGLRNKFRIR